MNINYKNKYLKYKNKYLKAKKTLVGGVSNEIIPYNPTTIYVISHNHNPNKTQMKVIQNQEDRLSLINSTILEYTLIDNDCGTDCCNYFTVKLLANNDIQLSEKLIKFIINHNTQPKGHKTLGISIPIIPHINFLKSILEQFKNNTMLKHIKTSIIKYIDTNLNKCGPELTQTTKSDKDYVFYLINLPYN